MVRPPLHQLELSKDEMRRYGYEVVDHLVEHFTTLADKSPVQLATRQQMESLLTETLPMSPTPPEEVLNHVIENVLNKNGAISHPKAYSFVPGPSNFIGSLADALSSGFNVFAGSWMASPAATQIEIIVINWLLEMFHFPVKQGGGLFTSGGSMANLTAIVTARRIRCGEDFSNSTIYLSDQAHSSNIKALNILGFKKMQVRIIPTDLEFRISLNKLKNAIYADKLAGKAPLCVIASAGTTNTGSIDPLDSLADLCKAENIWFHIDGAYGGAAILAKNSNQLLKGIERADSLTVDPHKWFFQPYEIGCLLVKDYNWLTETFTEKPEYLRDVEGNSSEINFYDHGVQLTRSFRALKLYMSLKTFGLDAFKQAVKYNIDLAQKVEKVLRQSDQWEVVSSATIAVINFRFNPLNQSYPESKLDEINQLISQHIIESGEALLATTVLQNQVVLRMCLINPRTSYEHVMETITHCENFAAGVL
ncbi:MAG: aspartate aminotransferase family protein [Acidiferrobacterales bacterium]|nr:aspartate aminotransferase family protein [Acidiferrobacterales bacterium]